LIAPLIAPSQPRPARHCRDQGGVRWRGQGTLFHDSHAREPRLTAAVQFYMCGSGRISKGVKSSLVQIIREANDLSVEEAQNWFDE
jgi:hypothetical protein